MKRPAHLAELLDVIFAGMPLQGRLREGRIWQVWEEAVGPQIASRAIPASFRDGTLTIRVAGSAWMQQLSLLKGEIISHLNDACGEQLVREIFLKQGSIIREGADREEPFRPVSRELTPEESSWVEEQGGEVADPELRQALESLLTRHLRSLP